MRQIPSWAWSAIAVGLVVFGFGLGGGGPEGRTVSRMIYPLVTSLLLPAVLFSYLQQFRRPTRKLWFINLAAVIATAYVTFPIWHFGVVLPETPGDPVTMRWWVNGVVLVLGIVMYLVLARVTRPLEPRVYAVEEKPEHLTI